MKKPITRHIYGSGGASYIIFYARYKISKHLCFNI